MINIVIADDHEMFIDGLCSILKPEEGISILGTARNGVDLLALLKEETPDIILLDISMPELNGHDAALKILKEYPDIKIMMVTMHNSPQHILPILKMGVKGYMLKNAGKRDLLSGIKTLYDKGYYYSPEITANLANAYKREEDSTVVLSTRELEVLQLVFDGCSTTEISDKLFISYRTAETHRRNLLNKTDCKNAAQLIQFALHHGLVKHNY